ncbi:LysR substrate-binding domain-containing protein [Sneathiella litorea]|uniref:LysR family transcriptional regulator n=1 Tax=Sneathiella litorea TaxID=2606216 RepID=A0A6L8W8V9_9PROT|nr:LysR substrate-binding domain-containing protein [Sneathiella litorea]MZR31535.1 LysR family transcriptional regulator [Sneathiella litorea]
MKPPIDLRLLQAFIILVETGSVSETARRIGRTQPAVTLQIKRLEEAVNVTLFNNVGRKLVLTNNGELLLGYARTIMSLQNEVMVRIAAPKLSGRVVLGVPDLYAAYIMPEILSRFFMAFPDVEIEIRTQLSSPLIASLEKGEIDLALVTGMRAFRDGQVVAQEPLVWVTGANRSMHDKNPVPLALLPTGNVFRDIALAGLETTGRKWKVSLVSTSIAGLQAAVLSGFAVSAIAKSSIIDGMRILGEGESFPKLPSVDLVLYRAGKSKNAAVDAMGDMIAEELARTNISTGLKTFKTQAGSGAIP